MPVDLNQFPLLSALPAAAQSQVGRILRPRRFDQGQLIIDRLDDNADVFFVISGRVLAVYWTDAGKEIVFSRIAAGHAFGELAAIDGGPRSLSVYAQTETDLLVLPQAQFLDLIDRHKEMRDALLRALVTQIRALTERAHSLVSQSVAERVAGHLLRSALDAGVFRPSGVIADPPTHAEIGNSIGANREAVSRVLSEMNKSGMIDSNRKRIKLLDPDRMSEMLALSR